MVTIELAEPWTYRTPQKTIHYPAGEHSVFQYVADQAEAEGVIAPSGTPDPLDGSIEQVVAHLSTVDDLAELTRLRANEVAGKTRKGALEAIEARRDELTAD